MPRLVGDLAQLPLGSHAVSFFDGPQEAVSQAVAFLRGTPQGQPARYWVGDPSLLAYYSDELVDRAPQHVDDVHFLDGPQAKRGADGKLRPTGELRAFVSAHPEGVTAAGDTITQYWSPETVPDHLEYEEWFQNQPREDSRFLCPYSLRKIPLDRAPEILRELGDHHTHVALSESPAKAVQLLQLFIFGNAVDLPPELRDALEWAQSEGLVELTGPLQEMTLTAAGEGVVKDWGRDPSFGA